MGKSWRLSGATLKAIAMVTMTIDHLAAALLLPLLSADTVPSWLSGLDLPRLYNLMRGIGRIAFPIFAFLLVEGLLLTRSKKKMGLRLLLVGLISEPFFDRALMGSWVDWGHQNIFWTLLLAGLAIWAGEEVLRRGKHQALRVVPLLLAMGIAQLTRVDYGAIGVAAIGFYWLFRGLPYGRVVATIAGYFGEAVLFWGSPLYVIPLLQAYDGTRGRQWKWLSYLFYPGHLAILALAATRLYPA